MTKRIYVECDYDSQYGRFWANLGKVSRDRREFLEDPKSFDLVGFTGGEDVSPSLYGHKNLASGNSVRRDTQEVETFNLALKNDIPMTGICRGTQLLNVMCGGTMVQHLRKSHGGGKHFCLTTDTKRFLITSAHHQMIVPSPEGELLAWAEQALGVEDLVYDGDMDALCDALGNTEGEILVPEAIAYPELKIFGVQGHPEWMGVEEEGCQWTLQKIREICWNEKQKTLNA